MYHFWDSILRPLLDAAAPATILEIGVGAGQHTSLLLPYAREHGIRLHCIDTIPPDALDAWQREYPDVLQFHTGTSLEILPRIPQVDVVLIDGDHNWHTVYHELGCIEQQAEPTGRFPLIVLHDLDWPYGRRDLYYDSDRIPVESRQSIVHGGLLPGFEEPVRNKGMNAHFMHARQEGGARNGVRSAVEEFLQSSAHSLRFWHIPGFHGLGIIASEQAIACRPFLADMLLSLHFPQPAYEHIVALEGERLASFILCIETVQELHKERTAAQHLHSNIVQIISYNRIAEATRDWKQKMLTLARLTMAERENENRALRNVIAKVQGRMVQMESTLSWRLTTPLRRIGLILGRGSKAPPILPVLPPLPPPPRITPKISPEPTIPPQAQPIFLTAVEREKSMKRVRMLGQRPGIVITVRIETPYEILLRKMLNMVLEQTYPNWTLLAFYGEHDTLARSVLDEYIPHADGRIVPQAKGDNLPLLSEIFNRDQDVYLLPMQQHHLLSLDALERFASTAIERNFPAYIIGSSDKMSIHDEIRDPHIVESGSEYLQNHWGPFQGNVAILIDKLRSQHADPSLDAIDDIGAIHHLSPPEPEEIGVIPSITLHQLDSSV